MHGPTTLLSRHGGQNDELTNLLTGLFPAPRGERH